MPTQLGQNQSWPRVGRTHWAEVRAGPALPLCWAGVSVGFYLGPSWLWLLLVDWPCLPLFSLGLNSSSTADQSAGQGPVLTVSLKVQGALIWLRNSQAIRGHSSGGWVQDQPRSPRSIPQLLNSKGFDWNQKNYGNAANCLPSSIQP